MPASLPSGFITLPSKYPVEVSLQRLESLLNERGIKIFARIDHNGEAEKVGFTMPPTKLLIFGNPKGGTPIMQAAPTAAIDLPLKALFWEDADGKSWLTYNDPAYLQSRHGFPPELVANLSGVNALLRKAVE
jgi:uncharacterized protein (DUF302 family)